MNRHSGEGRNPVISNSYGCRIKSGMTNWRLFATPTFIYFDNLITGGIITIIVGYNKLILDPICATPISFWHSAGYPRKLLKWTNHHRVYPRKGIMKFSGFAGLGLKPSYPLSDKDNEVVRQVYPAKHNNSIVLTINSV